MNENSHKEASLPVCEMRLQLLRCQLEAHNQTVENKKTNLDALDKLTRTLLQSMDTYGDEYIPKKSIDLYRSANVDDNVFIRNFGSVYGVILCIESQIIKDIDDSVIGPFGAHSYDGSLLRFFGFYALCQEAE